MPYFMIDAEVDCRLDDEHECCAQINTKIGAETTRPIESTLRLSTVIEASSVGEAATRAIAGLLRFEYVTEVRRRTDADADEPPHDEWIEVGEPLEVRGGCGCCGRAIMYGDEYASSEDAGPICMECAQRDREAI